MRWGKKWGPTREGERGFMRVRESRQQVAFGGGGGGRQSSFLYTGYKNKTATKCDWLDSHRAGKREDTTKATISFDFVPFSFFFPPTRKSGRKRKTRKKKNAYRYFVS
jgi:hypothetical protein